MSIRPFRDIKRRVTKVVNVGNVKVGGNNPISVQSMTNTLTKNVKETLNQINKISEVYEYESSTVLFKEKVLHRIRLGPTQDLNVADKILEIKLAFLGK